MRDDSAAQAPLRDGLREALIAGQRVLMEGGSALDGVEGAVRALEDCEHFNAGRGSALTCAGTVEMDAAIMCGTTGAAGAVAAVTSIVHPVSAARAVMERSGHVLMTGEGAVSLAVEAGLETAAPEFFVTAQRRAQLDRAQAVERVVLDHDGGTVGAVALDRAGHLAAATSTGGMTNQLPGRVGDSPIVGAGTWAADARCAVSATGHGELILRACVAHEIDAAMRLAGLDLEAAARHALSIVEGLGAAAGCIALDGGGVVSMPFGTPAMPRGVVRGDGVPLQAIYAEKLAP